MWQLLPRRPPHMIIWSFSPGHQTKSTNLQTFEMNFERATDFSLTLTKECLCTFEVMPGFQQLPCSSCVHFFLSSSFSLQSCLPSQTWSKLNHRLSLFLFLCLAAGDVGLWSWAERQSEGDPGRSRHARNYSESGDLTGAYFTKSDSAPQRSNQCITDVRLLEWKGMI